MAEPAREFRGRRLGLEGLAIIDERGRELPWLVSWDRKIRDLCCVEREPFVPKRRPDSSAFTSLMVTAFGEADLSQPEACGRTVEYT